MVIKDKFSKSLHLIIRPNLSSAFEVAELVFNHMFRYFVIPEDIVSGWDVQFMSRNWGGFRENLCISLSLLSGYHLQANGQVERAN